ncbi:MAG: PASTA domain-containing protein [Actinomycetota bacterium]|nr:PASTA domain-containing protein [Actinomycetota bacterium]
MAEPELVPVPALVGLDAAQVHDVALAARLVAVDPDPDTPPTTSGVVARQHPAAGTRVPAGEAITIWIDPGPGDDDEGGGGLPRPHAPEPVGPAGVK